jgi:hypothetical protein
MQIIRVMEDSDIYVALRRSPSRSEAMATYACFVRVCLRRSARWTAHRHSRIFRPLGPR